ncbi:MAG: hypothetical protein V4747_13980 [Pseudomonadota bacterium]
MPETALQVPDPISFTNAGILSMAKVISLAEVVARRADKFTNLIDALESGVRSRAAEGAESFARAGFTPKDQQIAVSKAAATIRREVSVNSSDARWAQLKELNTAASNLATTAQLWASPVTVLARSGLGTPERTAFQQQLCRSGTVELKNAALLAIATNNNVLAAALVTIIDQMPARSRPFSAQALADKLVGEETRRVQSAIMSVRLAAQRAINRNREWESGKARTLDRLKLARNQKGAI